ncbi:MAG TPA: hypothetical protein VFB82_00050 [Blastocatellia bacterium]|nr:hypothetical protein [Blastocatellia bacterium]
MMPQTEIGMYSGNVVSFRPEAPPGGGSGGGGKRPASKPAKPKKTGGGKAKPGTKRR